MTDKEMHDLIAKAIKERTDSEAQHIIDRHVDGYAGWSKTLKKKIYSSTAVVTVLLLLFATGNYTLSLHTGTNTMHNAVDDMELQSMYADVETFCNLGCSHSEVIDMIIDSKTMIA
ncbi:MAG: hypothetical protein J6V54_10100 [Bacteroidales bacterium]|nr:hypothetical protein [Bacteroidales bacterium]